MGTYNLELPMSRLIQPIIVVLSVLALLFGANSGCTCNNDKDQSLGTGDGDSEPFDDDTEDDLPVFDDDFEDDDTVLDDDSADDDDDDTGDIPYVQTYDFLISPEGMQGVVDGDTFSIPDDQAGVPGENFQYVGELCGSITGCEDNTDDVAWSTSDEELAVIDESGLVTLLDYGMVEVIGVVTLLDAEQMEYTIEDRAVIYIQPDILALDRGGRIGAIDYSNSVVDLSTVLGTLPNPSEDFIVLGHHAYVIGLNVDEHGVVFTTSIAADNNVDDDADDDVDDDADDDDVDDDADDDVDDDADDEPVNVILSTSFPVNPQVLDRNGMYLAISSLDSELIYLFGILSKSVSGTIRMPYDSTPFGLTSSDINGGATFITLPFEDNGVYGQGSIEIRNSSNLFVWSFDTSANPRYLVPMVVEDPETTEEETKLYAICGGDQVTSFGVVEVFTQAYEGPETTIEVSGYPEAFATCHGQLFVGDKSKPRVYVIDAATDSLVTFDTGKATQDYLGLPYGTGVRDMYYDQSRDLIYIAAGDSYVIILDPIENEFLVTYTLPGYDLVGVTSW
jgi:hypothetical protein